MNTNNTAVKAQGIPPGVQKAREANISTRRYIDWNRISKFEFGLIDRIVKRALPLYEQAGIADNMLTISMDLAAAHLFIPIALDELVAAPEGDFAHDVFGIRRHINRVTLELEDCFWPRYAI